MFCSWFTFVSFFCIAAIKEIKLILCYSKYIHTNYHFLVPIDLIGMKCLDIQAKLYNVERPEQTSLHSSSVRSLTYDKL